jgi:hypothetical protein
MSEVTINTLFRLFDKYKVEIPKVQRDYAQGRLDDHAKMVRHNLLEDMKAAILGETPPLDLNFVYGKAEDDKFIPLDGQQRLTTLFLLYLYTYYDDDKKTDLLRRFTYETRSSSRNFLEKLTEKRKEVFMSDLTPSEEIEDSEWFVSTWKYDPTIQSALIMLDDIKKVFGNVDDLAERLSGNGHQPIVFNFLEMKDLGMEDSLYIKLNARGKPLTPFENFKARLIGRLKTLELIFEKDFEDAFDREWTDLFWSNYKEDFDETYLTFFGILLMNQGIITTDSNWADTLDFEKIDEITFKKIFYTLNFLNNNRDNKIIHQLIFNGLREKRTYQDRLLFHAVTSYLYMSKGNDKASFKQWIRIFSNLILNSQIDTSVLYRRSIESINMLKDKWENLIDYFSKKENVSGFSLEQIKEEQIKAQIILQDDVFAEEIHKAEQHPYFSGQIRSALYFALDNKKAYNKDSFLEYWNKIDLLFEETKPKHGHLLRRALLDFGDYTLPVSAYKTLCIDDPNEASSTPSLKRLFSNNNIFVKKLLDKLNLADNISSQLENIVKNSVVPKNDWRYCLIKIPDLFSFMSTSHLRLRSVKGQMIVVPNKSSNGYTYEIFSLAMKWILNRKKGLESELRFQDDIGTWVDRYLFTEGLYLRFKDGQFIIKDEFDQIVFKTKTDDPLEEAVQFVLKH